MIGKLAVKKEILKDIPLADAIDIGNWNPARVTPTNGVCKKRIYKKLINLDKLLGIVGNRWINFGIKKLAKKIALYTIPVAR